MSQHHNYILDLIQGLKFILHKNFIFIFLHILVPLFFTFFSFILLLLLRIRDFQKMVKLMSNIYWDAQYFLEVLNFKKVLFSHCFRCFSVIAFFLEKKIKGKGYFGICALERVHLIWFNRFQINVAFKMSLKSLFRRNEVILFCNKLSLLRVCSNSDQVYLLMMYASNHWHSSIL